MGSFLLFTLGVVVTKCNGGFGQGCENEATVEVPTHKGVVHVCPSCYAEVDAFIVKKFGRTMKQLTAMKRKKSLTAPS